MAAALSCLMASAQAAQQLGVVQEFTAVPPVADWSAPRLTGGGGDWTTPAQMDAGIQTIANSTFTVAFSSATTYGTHGGAYVNTAAGTAYTDPTGVSGVPFVCILQNTTGSDAASVDLSYDQSFGNYTTEEIPGFRVYWSLTGAASSWTAIPELCVGTTNGHLSANVQLGTWAAGGTLYILWVDDNGNGQTDGYNAIDNFLANVGGPPEPPTIVSNPPAAISVAQNRSTNLTIVASGSQPLYYQWYLSAGGPPAAIPGATSATYAITNMAATNAGTYFCRVTNSVGTADSLSVVVTYVADETPPSVVSAKGNETFDKITIRFDEPMAALSISDVFNYSVSGGSGDEIVFADVVVMPDSQGVVMVLERSMSLLEENALYTVTVLGGVDLAGNGIGANNSATFRSFLFCPGFLNFASYDSGAGSDVPTLTNSPSFPDAPRERLYMTAFDTRTVYPDDSHNNYGGRVTGVFIPPESGNWVFFLSSDEQSELWLGSDPATRSLLAQETTCCRPFTSNAMSAPVFMMAGERYALEGLYQAPGAGDFLRVAAKLDTDPTPPDCLVPIPGKYLGCYADTNGVQLSITLQPSNQVAIVPATPTLLAAENFTTTNGGYTVVSVNTPAKPWTYSAASGTWTASDGYGANCGTVPFRTSRLNSPYYRVPAAETLNLSFTHRYSFEADTTFWDGGQVRLSVNGSPYLPVPGSSFTANGYSGVVGGTDVPNNDLLGQEAFVGQSPGYGPNSYITSTATLGPFNAGDFISVQFLGAWDDCAEGTEPNWEIDSVAFDPAVESRLAEPVVTFAIAASALIPGYTNQALLYQWQKDTGSGFEDIPVAGGIPFVANAASYPLQPGLYDNGASLRCVVRTPGLSATSQSALLTVTVPVERPPLSVFRSGNQVVIAWPSPSTDFVLQQNPDLNTTAWTDVTLTVSDNGTTKTVVIDPPTGNMFYRLRKP